MNYKKYLLSIAAIALLFTACKKEGDNIVNYYGTSDEGKNPTRKVLKAYGISDSSQNLRLSYLNNQPGKLSELVSLSSGTPTSKLAIQYSGNNPSAFQLYTLPANTLSGQGTFRVDAKGRVIQVVQRKINGDTTGICFMQYDRNTDYQPSAFSYYDKSSDRITDYEYMTYDKDGNVVKSVSYINNGSKTYKSSESEASGFGKGINPLTQLYYYLISQGNIGGSGALYFSNYIPNSIRQQNYNADGTLGSANLTDIESSMDNEDNVLTLNAVNSSAVLYFRY